MFGSEIKMGPIKADNKKMKKKKKEVEEFPRY